MTCARHLESESEQELKEILAELGDTEPKITITKMSGILTVNTILEPKRVVKKIRDKILDEPWTLRYCLRIIPIQRTTKTEIDSIEKEVLEISDLISKDEKYRISIEKRNTDVSTQDIITKIAKHFKNKVSLEFPDKIILIEILGNITGLAIIKNSDILSVEKIKRSMSE